MATGYQPVSLEDDKPHINSKTASSSYDPLSPSQKHAKYRSALIGLFAGLLLYPLATFCFGPAAQRFVENDMGEAVGWVETELGEVEMCDTRSMLPVVAPHANVWKNLDIPTATSIRNYLWQPKHNFNLTRSHLAAENDNAIILIEAYPPPKEATLRYLHEGGKKPQKYAHAIIHQGAIAKVQDFLIGPLPISDETTIRPLREIYHRPDIPFNAHGGISYNSSSQGRFLASIFAPMEEASQDLFNASFLEGSLIGAGNSPLSYDGSWRRMWVELKGNRPGSYLYPIDLYAYVDMTGSDPSLWHLLKVVYNQQIFNSTTDFVSAWRSGTLKRSPAPKVKETSDWATRKRKGNKRDLDDRAGPRSISFDGPRFRVDEEEQYITWMGWQFYLGFERDMGLNLWDIRFRGDRVIYELAPQEAMAQYSGVDPHQATTVFLDRAFGMGNSVKELIIGYDCPAEAAYLPATIHTATGSTTRLNAICVFERDSNKPISRHTGWLKDEMGAIKGYEFVVRSISTVGNYDYIFDYTFQLDGTIEIRVSASGYLQGGVWSEAQHPYGHRIRDTAMGSLHDHVINYKVDFDVAGTNNSLMQMKLEVEDKFEPWFADDWGTSSTQQRVVRTMITNENDSRLEYAKNMEGGYVITNEDEKNSWGNPRGYTIHPGASTIHLTNLDCKRTENNVNWAKHHLSVTRRKDTEPWSSSMWNIHLPGAPTVDFYKFFDGESLEQEDLTVWLNLGTHHIPRAEDSPQTLTNMATSSVLLTPFNFADFDLAHEASNAVVLNAPFPGQPWLVHDNGIQPKYCMPKRESPISYTGMLSYDEFGAASESLEILEQRKEAESWHGLHAEF